MKGADPVILQELANYGGWMKPASLHLNVHFSRNYVGQRCRELARHELLEQHDEGAYRISDRGHQYVNGELNPDDLED